jgi:hypothetical protein
MKLTLANALGLRPLDRLQINNRHEIREMEINNRMRGAGELPFFFFQRVLDDGKLEVRSPGGYVTAVSPADICDIIPGEIIIVRAMTAGAFLQRSVLTVRDRQQAPGPECFAEAYLLYAMKDKWGRPDFYVWFVDPALNTTGRPWRASLMEADRQRVNAKARRTVMPVSSKAGGNYSADGGCKKEADYNKSIAQHFIAASINRNSKALAVLSMAGIRRISQSDLNKLAA